MKMKLIMYKRKEQEGKEDEGHRPLIWSTDTPLDSFIYIGEKVDSL